MLAPVLLVGSLGLDTLAVSLALGIGALPRSRWWMVGVIFAACEGGAPIVGLLLGSAISHHLARAVGWVGGGLLIAIGAAKLLSLQRRASGHSQRLVAAHAERPFKLLLLGLSVSIDNLAVGVSLGAVTTHVGLVLLIIPLQTILATAVGLNAGRLVGRTLGYAAAAAAALVLIVVGVFLLITRL